MYQITAEDLAVEYRLLGMSPQQYMRALRDVAHLRNLEQSDLYKCLFSRGRDDGNWLTADLGREQRKSETDKPRAPEMWEELLKRVEQGVQAEDRLKAIMAEYVSDNPSGDLRWYWALNHSWKRLETKAELIGAEVLYDQSRVPSGMQETMANLGLADKSCYMVLDAWREARGACEPAEHFYKMLQIIKDMGQPFVSIEIETDRQRLVTWKCFFGVSS